MGILEFITNNSDVIAEVLGVFALICLCVSFFVHNNVLFFTLQNAGNVFTVLSLFVQGDYFASIGCIIATIRTGIFGAFAAKNKEVPWWLVFALIGANIVSCVILWSGPLDLIFMVGLSVYTLAFKVKNGKKMRCVLIIPNVLYCVFYLATGSYALLLSSGITLISLLVSIVTETVYEKKIKKLSEKEKAGEKVE